jgi:hypothetical protein
MNVFKDLSIKCFPESSYSDKDLINSEIDRFLMSLDSLAPAQENQVVNKFHVSEIDDVKELLEQEKKSIDKPGYLDEEAKSAFDSLYGKMIAQVGFLMNSNGITKEEFTKICAKFTLNEEEAQAALAYNKTPLRLTAKKETEARSPKTLQPVIPLNDYQLIKGALNELGFKSPITMNNLGKYLDTSNQDLVAWRHRINEIRKKTNASFSPVSQNEMLDRLIGYFESDSSYQKLSFSCFLYDLDDEKKQILSIVQEGKLPIKSAEAEFLVLVKIGYSARVIKSVFDYWSIENGFDYSLPTKFVDYDDSKVTCQFCGIQFPSCFDSCPNCSLSIESVAAFMNLIDKGNAAVIRRDYGEARKNLGFAEREIKQRWKLASKETKNRLSDLKNGVHSLSKRRRKAKILSFSILGVFMIGVVLMFVFSYWPYHQVARVEDIHVKTSSDFASLNSEKILNDNIYLDNDISFFGDYLQMIGSASKPFKGHFYGEGHILSDFKISDSSGSSALFFTNEGTIERLGIKDATIEGGSIASAFALVNKGTIKNCFASSSLFSVNEELSYVSGFAYKNEGTLTNCYCVSDSAIGSFYLSGFVAVNEGTISNSFACFSFDSSQNPFGSFYYFNGGAIENVYSNIPAIYTSYDFGDKSLAVYDDAEFHSISFYQDDLQWGSDDWDLTNVGMGYPELRKNGSE